MRGLVSWVARVYMFLFVTFMMAPILFVILSSFNKARYSSFPPEGFSLQWYLNLLQVPDFFRAMGNSAFIALFATAVALLVGTGGALAIVRGPWRRREILQSAFLSPLLVPRIVFGIAAFVAAIKVSLYPSFVSIILAHAALTLPYVLTVMVASLLQVRRVLEEAAMDLGANAVQTFKLAVVPQIQRALLVAAVFSFILSFDELDTSLFLVRASNMTLPMRMFLYMQEIEDPTLAALSTLLIGLSIIAVVIVLRLSRGMNVTDMLRRGRRI